MPRHEKMEFACGKTKTLVQMIISFVFATRIVLFVVFLNLKFHPSSLCRCTGWFKPDLVGNLGFLGSRLMSYTSVCQRMSCNQPYADRKYFSIYILSFCFFSAIPIHYENMPKQYTASFNAVKSEIFSWKKKKSYF